MARGKTAGMVGDTCGSGGGYGAAMCIKAHFSSSSVLHRVNNRIAGEVGEGDAQVVPESHVEPFVDGCGGGRRQRREHGDVDDEHGPNNREAPGSQQVHPLGPGGEPGSVAASDSNCGDRPGQGPRQEEEPLRKVDDLVAHRLAFTARNTS